MQTELTQLKLRAAFRTQHLSDKDFLSYEHLLLAMSKLAGSQFDEETFQQLWDECILNSSGEARVGEFISHLLAAEKILVQKMRALSGERKRWETAGKDRSIEYSQVRNIERQLSHVEEELGLLMESLDIVRHPFARQAAAPLSAYQRARSSAVESGVEAEKEEDPDMLQWILYLSLLILTVGWVGSLLLNRFLEQTMCGFILGSLLLETVSKKTLKASMLICLLSMGLDIVWLGLYIIKLWYPALNYEMGRLFSSYLQLSITLTLILLLIKAVLAYLLFAIDFQQLEIYRLRFFSHNLVIENGVVALSANANPIIYGLMAPTRVESDIAF